MSLITRFANGWTITKSSFKVLKENKQLIIFPILSGISLLLIFASFFTVALGFAGWNVDNMPELGTIESYVILFVFYIINYFVVVFFNMALIHCTSLYFKGEEITIRKGIDFSMSRIGSIFAWAVFAGTIGAILKIIQENVGALGKIITGIIGIVWGIATFFVVPVIAYENLGPIGALKKSTNLMKEKWGERIGAGFSLFLVEFIAILAIAAAGFILGSVNVIAGVAIVVIGILLLLTVISAVKTIFISAIYHNIQGDPVELFNQQFIDNLFETKKK
jgi:hypothetical protein